MKRLHRILLSCAVVAVLSAAPACSILNGSDEADDGGTALMLAAFALSLNTGCAPYAWSLPANFPAPAVPADNCITTAKVDLGRHLFYDKRLSQNETASCASCHFQEFAFADQRERPTGITGETHPRNSQHLSNAGYHTRLNWANNRTDSLERQAFTPLFAESTDSTIVELGLSGDAYLDKLRNESYYQEKFAAAFGAGDTFNDGNIRKALASFLRTMISGNSSYDQFQNGTATISASARRGAVFFNSEVAECFHCHGGFNFTDTTTHSGSVFTEFAFHNNGIYSEADYAAKLSRERGLYDLTLNSSDEGRHRAPSLRNIEVTFPYMHDGSFDCNPQDGVFKIDAGGDCGSDAVDDMLGHVIDHYSNGSTKYADGTTRTVHPQVDASLIREFTISSDEKADLIAFLRALTDYEFLNNSAFSNPREGDANFGR